MRVKRSLVSAVLAAGLALSLVACNGDSKPDSASTPSATPTPTPTASSTTPTVAPTTPAAPKPRTKAELTKALLGLSDMPSGFAVDDSGDGEDDGSGISSTDSRCKEVVKLFNADTAPGSIATAGVVFSGGESGPFVQEDLDALPSAAAATALVNRAKAAIRSCKKVRLTLTGAGTSPARISEISTPKAGTARVGVRFAATSGPLEGFQVTFVIAALGDVVLGMSFDDPSLIGDGVTLAAAKANRTLGTAKAGT
ncbi:PknH-like protein [Kribbella antiqua]|uniref:PknH-like protein n=1 Tax=Kribbella antiqua TaxID=2512217 RepID=A0A4R2ITL6_9ACTN|nr:PknH-like protein [Kribbella antiqua]